MEFTVRQIGIVHSEGEEFSLEIAPEYRQAMIGLEGFDWIQVIWWFDGCDNARSRGKMTEQKPYKNGPETLGVFATRAPERPNPIAVSPSCVTRVDREKGVIHLAWIDARDGTPVLDIKPYVPAVDRVEAPVTPAWCAHWPKNVESSGEFDWSAEFNF